MGVLQKIFDALGPRLPGKLLAATAIGALLPLMAGIPKGEILAWCAGGAVVGFSAGLLLVNPKLVFGAIVLPLGLFVTVAPLSFADGRPVPLPAHLAKYGMGIALFLLGTWLVVSGLRRLNDSRSRTGQR